MSVRLPNHAAYPPVTPAGAERRAEPTTVARRRRRLRLSGLALALVVAAPFALVSCAAAAKTPTKPTKAQIEKTCTAVSDVLSDGPDPSVDPVGYALAQVIPLRAIKTTDTSLKKDIDSLAGAYQTFVKDNGKKSANAAVNAAGKSIDKVCPGAF